MPNQEYKLQPRLMRMRQLSEYCSLSQSYLYQLIAEGKFPAGQKINSRLTVWERSVVDAALDEMTQGVA